MWERFKSWVRGLFGINREDILEFVKNPLASDEMLAAYEEWYAAFINQPGWLKRGWASTRFPGVVTSWVATLCAAEIKLSVGDIKTDGRAKWLHDQVGRHVMGDVRNHIQKAAALSYVILKPFNVGDNIFCEVVTPDCFIPTKIVGGIIRDGVFIDKKVVREKHNSVTYFRLEEHTLIEDGVRITQRAFRERIKKSSEIPLSDVDEWKDLEPEVFVDKADRPLFAMLKMPFANQIDPASKLPTSLYANAMGSFEKLDRFYNDFIWDVESGRRKQIFDVAAVAFDERSTGSGVTNLDHYDTTDQYIALNMNDGDKTYDDYSPTLRADSYQTAMNMLIRVMESQIGVSSDSFGFDVKRGLSRAKTATEVLSDDNETYNTVKAIQENGLRQGLLDLVYIYDLYATLYNMAPAGAINPTLEFGDSIFEDTGVEFTRRKALADSGYYDPTLLLAWYFGVDESEAAGMLPKQPPQSGLFGRNAYGSGEDE